MEMRSNAGDWGAVLVFDYCTSKVAGSVGPVYEAGWTGLCLVVRL